MADVERTLNSLRRLPENRKCGTCTKEDKFGHKNVCMKFHIFICSDCKSAHQAFSHKCKSVTMSNWSREEVESLKAPHGGNVANAATIFAKLRKDSDAYPKGCPPDEVKSFVHQAYNELRWAGDAEPSANVATPPQQSGAAPSSDIDLFGDFEAPPPVATVRSAPVPANSIDLFGAFASPPPLAESRSAPVSTDSINLFGDFPSSPSPAAAEPLSAPVPADNIDLFGAFASSPQATDPAPSDKMDIFGDFASSAPALPMRPAATSFDELSSAACLQNTNFFEALEGAGVPALCPTSKLVRDEAGSPTSVVDATGTAERRAAGTTAGSAGAKNVWAGDGAAADLLSKLMSADLMGPTKAPEPPPTRTATPATPMAKMSTPATQPPKMPSPPTTWGQALDPNAGMRAPLGADFVDLSAMRRPAAPVRPMHPASMHAPMRANMPAGMF